VKSDAHRSPTRPDDSFLAVWGRRAISVPTYFALATAILITAPLWLVAAGLTDVLTGKARRLPRARALAFFALYLVCEVLGVVCAACLWLATFGGRWGGRQRYVALNAALQRHWTAALFGGALHLFAMRVHVEGQELARSGPLLLFVRHSSTADTVLAAALVANPNRLLLRYVLKRELFWDPCLDIVGRRLPNAFVDRASPRSRAEVEAIARLAQGLDERSAVLIYPEGSRFSPEKLAATVAALRDKGKQELAAIAAGYRRVLPPKVGGPLALIDAAPGVDLVFVEHTGFEGAASFATFWNGALVGKTIQVRLRRIPAASIPGVARDRWLFERWAETDAWISARASPLEGAA